MVGKGPGVYKPRQKVQGSTNGVMLDTPLFFIEYFRRDPTSIYSDSFFVSSITTIAARQQVINDLYRLMQITGWPRMDVKVLEEILINNASGKRPSGPPTRSGPTSLTA